MTFMTEVIMDNKFQLKKKISIFKSRNLIEGT